MTELVATTFVLSCITAPQVGNNASIKGRLITALGDLSFRNGGIINSKTASEDGQ